MEKFKRVFLIVADSFGVGAAPDAALFGDEGANTLGAVCKSPFLNVPFLKSKGLFNIDGVDCGCPASHPEGCFGKRQHERTLGNCRACFPSKNARVSERFSARNCRRA